MTETQNDQQHNLEAEELALSDFKPSVSRHFSRSASQKSTLTVVNTKKSGKRLAFDPEILRKIGAMERVQVGIHTKGIVLGLGITGDNNYFKLSKGKSKEIPEEADKFTGKLFIYSSGLVEEITEIFSLDFSKITSISFQNVKFLKINEIDAAFISLVEENSEVTKLNDSIPAPHVESDDVSYLDEV